MLADGITDYLEDGWKNPVLMDAEVSQTPRHLITTVGKKVFLECLQHMNHERMFWYRQDPGLGLQLIYFSYDKDMNEKGDVPEGYDVSRKKRECFSLILESASTNQTSLYLCASSLSTALLSHILSAQEEQIRKGRGPASELLLAPKAHLCQLEEGGHKKEPTPHHTS
ncbi:T-cell receptor beta chain V region PHDS203 [Tupaia chinensis]|nr:T-cell receptor beta chain V region PHDS203 [Tupaia chinensis]